ncbi:MAG: hypothetical protein ACREJC_06600 [Tepidisphaeraceae bacterium]
MRKDFPQRLGLSIVILAAGAFVALAAWRQLFFAGALVLVAAAGVDALLYGLVGRVTVCYRCRAEFRDRPINAQHGPFDLSVGEKYRQRP